MVHNLYHAPTHCSKVDTVEIEWQHLICTTVFRLPNCSNSSLIHIQKAVFSILLRTFLKQKDFHYKMDLHAKTINSSLQTQRVTKRSMEMEKLAKVLLIFMVIITVFSSDAIEGGRNIKIDEDQPQTFPGVPFPDIPGFPKIPYFPKIPDLPNIPLFPPFPCFPKIPGFPDFPIGCTPMAKP